jgi:predicted metal-binding protein
LIFSTGVACVAICAKLAVVARKSGMRMDFMVGGGAGRDSAHAVLEFHERKPLHREFFASHDA